MNIFVPDLNRALSPLERMTANPLLSIPLSYRTPESSFSVSASLVRALIRSKSNKRCSTSSARRVWMAK